MPSQLQRPADRSTRSIVRAALPATATDQPCAGARLRRPHERDRPRL